MKCFLTICKSTKSTLWGIPVSYFTNILNKYSLIFPLVLFSISSFSQVGIGTTDPKATLDIRSSSQTTPSNIDGILIPRIDNFPVIVPASAQDGMMVYYTGSVTVTKGFYYWDNGAGIWKAMVGVKKINDLTDAKSDNDGTNNGSSIYLGKDAGSMDDESDNRNVGVGYGSMYSNVGNVDGIRNTALGYTSLYTNTTGNFNTAIGYKVLEKNLAGNSNTAIGAESLLVNEGVGINKGSFNTATGSQTLKANTVGSYNTANGFSALVKNINGDYNTAVGYYALSSNTSGKYNTAIGNGTLYSFTSGEKNIAIGTDALNLKISGDNNVANGSQSLNNNLFGSNNIAIGYQAGFFETGSNKLYIESSNGDANSALIYGDFQTNFLRFNADVEVNTGSLNVDGGTFFVDEVNNRVGIGTESPSTKLQIVGGTDAKLFNNTGYIVSGPEDGLNIVIDNNEILARNNGSTSNLFLQKEGGDVIAGADIRALGNVYASGVMLTSDRRLKRDISNLSYGLKEILQLEPKSYFFINSKQEYKSIGLIAQEVQPIIKEIVHTRDDYEKSLSINYIELIPILINAVKEQDAKIQELEKQLSQNLALEERLAKLEAGLTKSSESSKASEEVAKNEN